MDQRDGRINQVKIVVDNGVKDVCFAQVLNVQGNGYERTGARLHYS